MNRDFKGIWIPREIWINKNIRPVERMLWAEIHSLYDREQGGCHATNAYLAEFFDLSEVYIRKMLAKLKKFGLVEEVSFDGRRRLIRAVIPPEDLSLSDEEAEHLRKKKEEGYDPNDPYGLKKELSIKQMGEGQSSIKQTDTRVSPPMIPGYQSPIIYEGIVENKNNTPPYPHRDNGARYEASPPPQAGPPPCVGVSPPISDKKPKTDRKAPSRPQKPEELCTHQWGCVRLTQAEYEALVAKHGADAVEQLAEELADCIEAGTYTRKIKSYKAALDVWFRKDWHRSKSKHYREIDQKKKPAASKKDKTPSYDYSEAAYAGMKHPVINIDDLEDECSNLE